MRDLLYIVMPSVAIVVAVGCWLSIMTNLRRIRKAGNKEGFYRGYSDGKRDGLLEARVLRSDVGLKREEKKPDGN